ncbi:hypothetical protein LP420_11775 [Massilia sp. B-10]|nr:hypothetical protein LP420_11775 [Massilia sp. B-10]
MKTLALLLLALASGSAAAADTISAQRYVDAQGVEVIQNRSPAPTASTIKQLSGATERAASVKLAALKHLASGVRDARFQVSDEQARRDLDRVGILEQELNNEMRAVGEITRLSAALAGSAPGGPDQGASRRE